MAQSLERTLDLALGHSHSSSRVTSPTSQRRIEPSNTHLTPVGVDYHATCGVKLTPQPLVPSQTLESYFDRQGFSASGALEAYQVRRTGARPI